MKTAALNRLIMMRMNDMVFASLEEFYEKAAACRVLTRTEEKECARRMKDGDLLAQEKLVQSYLPSVAGYIRRIPPHQRTWGLAVYCTQALEKAVVSFDFLQGSETFSHRLNWWLRQATVRYAARHRD